MYYARVFEIVAVTSSLGVVAIGHRWAIRQLETGRGAFVGHPGTLQTWATLRDVDKWLQAGHLPDDAVVIWPASVLSGLPATGIT